tara:strand:+ start:100 stop:1392 length:1293 start_codon:yes stop_codon:yes gene_type:complete
MYLRFLLLVSLLFANIACVGTTSIQESSTNDIPETQNRILSTSDLFELTRAGIARLEVSTCDGDGIGTGFMISETQMVTVAHVVEGAEEILAIIDDEVANASIIAIDVERDLALLKTDIPFGDYYFALGDFDYRTGDEVSVIGFPRGLDITLTKGTISNDIVKIPEFPLLTFVQIDAAANPGNSGGPVLNSKGEVIGILKSGLRESEGLNFAISVDTVDRIFNSWRSNNPISMTNCGFDSESEIASPPTTTTAARTTTTTTTTTTARTTTTAARTTTTAAPSPRDPSAPDQPMSTAGYYHCTDCSGVNYYLVGAEFTGYERRVTDPDGFLSLEVWVVAGDYRESCEVRWWKQLGKHAWSTGLSTPPLGETTLEVAAICVPMVPGPISYEALFTDGNGNTTSYSVDPPGGAIGPLDPCTAEYSSRGWCVLG